MSDRFQWLIENGPSDPYQRVVLLELVAQCNDQWEVAASYAAIGRTLGIAERVVWRVIRQLEEGGFLARLPGGAMRVCARKDKNLDINIKTNTSESSYQSYGLGAHARENECRGGAYRGHSESTAQPSGTGARASLGVEDCPRCGGTGWMEVEPAGNGKQITVDVCICRGGRFDYVQVRDQQDGYASARKSQVNDDGVASVKEVLKWRRDARTQEGQTTGPSGNPS